MAWSAEDNDNQFSPPTTPTAEGPVEKKGRQDGYDGHRDGDEENQIAAGETKSSNFLTVQHHQSQMSIISMEEDEFDSDDEKVHHHT